MKKNFYIAVGFLMIAIFALRFFNISLTLPTTFKEMVGEQIKQDEQIANFDYDRISMVRIEHPTSSDGIDAIEIDDKDVISTLLSNELRIYKGGRFKENSDQYDMFIYFYGSIHRYTIADNYIITSNGNYKVLDENNEIFDYLATLYEEK